MPNPWLDRRPLHYAHQGGALEAPTSTMFAFRRAAALGAHGLETDVHMTRDGHLVVCHDATVDRTTDGSGPIVSLTLEEIERLDNAYWWAPGVEASRDAEAYPLRGRAPQDAALRVTRLDTLLHEFGGLLLNFDIKEEHGYEAVLADALVAAGRSDDVIVASFHDDALARFRAHAPHLPTAASSAEVLAMYQHVHFGLPWPELTPNVVALQIPREHEGIALLDARLVESAHEHGLAVHVWTIDDADEMHELLDLGVDAVITDRPSVLVDVLAAREAK